MTNKTRLEALAEFTGITKDKFFIREPTAKEKIDENNKDFGIIKNAKEDEYVVYYDVLGSEEEVEVRLRDLLHSTIDPDELIERFGSDDFDKMDISDERLEDYEHFEGEIHGYKIYSV